MSYVGQIALLPVGVGGLVGDKNAPEIGPDKLILANNISYESGTIEKEGGAAKYNTSAITGTPAIIGGHDWWPSEAVQRMIVVTDDGDILKDDGAGDFTTTLKSSLSVTGIVPIFMEGGAEIAANDRILFIYTKLNQVQMLVADAATTVDITTPAADWATAFPSFGLIHKDRHWAGGNTNDPHRIYYSVPTDHTNMTGAGSGSIPVYSGEGERIVGAVSFRGVIVIWKFPNGIYLIDTSSSDTANWSVSRLTTKLGGISAAAILPIDNDIIFMDSTADIHMLSAVQEFGDIKNSNLTDGAIMAPFIRDIVDFAGLVNARAIYYEGKREAHFAVPIVSGGSPELRIVLDFTRVPLKFRTSDRDLVESFWLRKDSNNVPRPIIGDNVGFIWELDQELRSKDGIGYVGEFQIADTDLSFLDPKFATLMKTGHFLELIVEPTGNFNINVGIFWDGNLTDTITFNLGSAGAQLGSFVFGTDVLAVDQVINRKRRIVGSGRRFGMAVRNSVDAQNFSLSRFYLHFTVGDERIET